MSQLDQYFKNRSSVIRVKKDTHFPFVSPSNQWLYIAADDGKCVVFDINSGSVEKIIRSFAEECSTRSEKASDITGIIHHPHHGMIGGFCNDKGQKRGILTIWK